MGDPKRIAEEGRGHMATSAKKTSAVKSSTVKDGPGKAGTVKKPVKAAAEKPKTPEKSVKEPAKKTGLTQAEPGSIASSTSKVKPKATSKPKAKATATGGSEAPTSAQPVVAGAPRLNVRSPEGADELKQKIGALATATAQIRNYKRALQKSFFDIGLILSDIDERKLYEVKGYGSFEAFLEREIDLGKQLGLKLSRAVHVFQREAAMEAGLERVSAAIAVLDGEVDPNAASTTSTPTSSGGARSPIPFHKL
jgi:hypothetical protein